MKKISIKKRGFTLVEMIVSLAIFTVVAVVAVGALVRVTGLNRQAQSLQSAMNNIGFAMEAFSREVRVGQFYHCEYSPNSWTHTGSNFSASYCDHTSGLNGDNQNNIYVFAFKSSKVDNDCTGGPERLIYAYAFVAPNDTGRPFWSILKATQEHCDDTLSITVSNPSDPSSTGITGDFVSILDDRNVHLKDIGLAVMGPSGVDHPFDTAYLNLSGVSGTRDSDINTFNLETAVSQRVHD